MPIIALEGLARPESGKRRPDHGMIAGGLLRVHPWVSLGFSRGLGEERAHEWTKGLATARQSAWFRQPANSDARTRAAESAVTSAPRGAMSESRRLHQGAGGYPRSDRRQSMLMLPTLRGDAEVRGSRAEMRTRPG